MKLAARALAVVVLCAIAFVLVELGPPSKGSKPISEALPVQQASGPRFDAWVLAVLEDESVHRQWMQRIFKDPDDSVVWTLELARARRSIVVLDELLQQLPADSTRRGIARAHELTLLGIALRHVHQPEEALRTFHDARSLLASYISSDYRCRSGLLTSECDLAKEIMAQSFSLAANLYFDQHDEMAAKHEAGSALKLTTDNGKYGQRLSEFVGSFVRMGLLTSACDVTITELSRIGWARDATTQTVAQLAESCLSRLFRSISWDPQTGAMRDRDARDFSDNWGIGIGRQTKYGMVDAEEDIATFATLLMQEAIFRRTPGNINDQVLRDVHYPSKAEFIKNLDVESYVRQQMKIHNYEPAAKYLFCRFLDTNIFSRADHFLTCPSSTPDDVSFAEVQRLLNAEPSSLVAPNTVDVIAMLSSAYDVLVKICTPYRP